MKNEQKREDYKLGEVALKPMNTGV